MQTETAGPIKRSYRQNQQNAANSCIVFNFDETALSILLCVAHSLGTTRDISVHLFL